MAKKKVPAYCLHRATGQAVVRLSGRDYYLGEHGSPASHTEYNRLIGEWLAGNGHLVAKTPDLTVSEVLAAYWRFAEGYYVQDGKPTSHLDRVRRSIQPVRQLYGELRVRSFGPLALQAVREWMVAQGWCRAVVNQRVDVVRRAFRWALSRELVPAAVVEGLRSVAGLRRGRSAAPDSPGVAPAPDEAVAAATALLSEELADAARLQLLTAARPGEVLALRASEIDRGGPVWVYRPGRHKTAHRGKSRLVLMGPQAQELLWRWLKVRCPLCSAEGLRGELAWRSLLCGPCADRSEEEGLAGPWPLAWPANEEYHLFSPRESMRRFRAEQRLARKSLVQPSQANRRTARPRRLPGERYSVEAYARAVARACKRAGVAHWHPHQLRHNAATFIRAEFGLDVARIVLGHSSAAVTEIYAEPNFAAALEAIRRAG